MSDTPSTPTSGKSRGGGRNPRARRGNPNAAPNDSSPLRIYTGSPAPADAPTHPKRPFQKGPRGSQKPRPSPTGPSTPSPKPPHSSPSESADSPQLAKRKPRPQAASPSSPGALQKPSTGSPAPSRERVRTRRKQRKPRKPRLRRQKGAAGNVSPTPPASLKLQIAGLPAGADEAWLSALLSEPHAQHVVYRHLHPQRQSSPNLPIAGPGGSISSAADQDGDGHEDSEKKTKAEAAPRTADSDPQAADAAGHSDVVLPQQESAALLPENELTSLQDPKPPAPPQENSPNHQVAFVAFDSSESMLSFFALLQRDHPSLKTTMAPYQALPRNPPFPLPLSGDIEQDPDFLQFSAMLENPGQSLLATQTPAPIANPSGLTPLLEDLNRRKAHQRHSQTAKQKISSSFSSSSSSSSNVAFQVAGPKRRKRTRTRAQRRAAKAAAGGESQRSSTPQQQCATPPPPTAQALNSPIHFPSVSDGKPNRRRRPKKSFDP